MSIQPIVTRFAPSPTGYLHIGGARTALFNWAFARKHGGRFILRIEDTDALRSSAESLRGILEDLQWLGIDWDEGPDPKSPDPYAHQRGAHGPYCQSQRLDIYNQHIDQLLQSGRAYKCFKTADELATEREQAKATGRPYRYDRTGALNLTLQQIASFEAEGRPCVIRFRMPDTDITIQDEVRGSVTYKADELDDFVIRKSDGFPTYHFAVVIDDALMLVNHVMRAQEHLNNTPKHWALQDALGFDHPVYAHMPLIFNADGTKMSKRDKAKTARKASKDWLSQHNGDVASLAASAGLPVQDVQALVDKQSDAAPIAEALARPLEITLPEIDVHDFRASGYLPQVINNYIALLGWSAGNDIEKFDMDFLTENFSLERIGKSNARFDRDKLFRFNADAIGQMTPDAFAAALRQYCSEFCPLYISKFDESEFALFADAYRERSRTFSEACDNGQFFIVADNELQYDAKAVAKVLEKNDGEGYHTLEDLQLRLADLPDWTGQAITDALNSYAESASLGLGKIAQPLRVALTGNTVSPPIHDTLVLIGRNSTLERIRNCLTMRK